MSTGAVYISGTNIDVTNRLSKIDRDGNIVSRKREADQDFIPSYKAMKKPRKLRYEGLPRCISFGRVVFFRDDESTKRYREKLPVQLPPYQYVIVEVKEELHIYTTNLHKDEKPNLL